MPKPDLTVVDGEGSDPDPYEAELEAWRLIEEGCEEAANVPGLPPWLRQEFLYRLQLVRKQARLQAARRSVR